MRAFALASMRALLLSGLPPAPLPARPSPAWRAHDPRRRSRSDLLALHPRFPRRDTDAAGYGRGRRVGRPRQARPSYAPPPPPRRRRHRRRMLAQEQAAIATTPARAAPQHRSVGGVIGGYRAAAGRIASAMRARRSPPSARRRCAGLDLRRRCRHRQLFQRPPHAQRRPDAAPGGGADRGDAELFPLRLSRARRPLAAVQRQHRHDDDAVERQHPAAARRPARL